MAVIRLDGMAVARTERTESPVAGETLMLPSPADIDALRRWLDNVATTEKMDLLAYSSEARELSWAMAVAQMAAMRKALNCILTMVIGLKR